MLYTRAWHNIVNCDLFVRWQKRSSKSRAHALKSFLLEVIHIILADSILIKVSHVAPPNFEGAGKCVLCLEGEESPWRTQYWVPQMFLKIGFMLRISIIKISSPSFFLFSLTSCSVHLKSIQLKHTFQEGVNLFSLINPSFPDLSSNKSYIWFFLEKVLMSSRVEIGLEQTDCFRTEKDLRMLQR